MGWLFYPLPLFIPSDKFYLPPTKPPGGTSQGQHTRKNMKQIHRTKSLLAFLTAGTFGAAAVNGAAVIYEPFSQAAGDLNAKAASTTGLTGNWSDGNTVTVVTTPTLTYGDLQNTGGQVNLTSSASTWAAASTNSALSTAGLLTDGATLWFSYVFKKSSHGGSNEQSGFAFASERVNPAFNGLNLNATGYGFGVFTNGSSVVASSWSNSTARSAGSGTAALQDSTPDTPANNDGFGTTFVIGKIQWNNDPGLNDSLSIWTRALDNIATEPTTGASTRSAVILQGQLDTISFGQRNSGGTHTYDEIRFGATFADVAVAIPEPSATLLGGIGFLMLLRRRSR